MKRPRILALTLALALLPALGGWAQPAPSAKAAVPNTPAATPAAKATPPFAVTGIKEPAFMKSAATITAAELKDYLSFIAADEMEGRQTPSRGLDTTARFLATVLSRAGVKPGGDDGGYFQKIVLKKEKVTPSGTEVELGGTKFAYGKDFLASAPADP